VLGPLSAEYAALGRERTRQGSRSKNSSPRGCYRTLDDRWMAISGSTPKMAERFLRSYGLADLLNDPRFATNQARVEHATELDQVLERVIASKTLAENLAIVEANALTAAPVQTMADIERDPHWRARQLTIPVPDAGGGTVRMHNVFPRFSQTPGRIRWPGGALGQDNVAVFGELGLTAADLEALRNAGVI
jgi:crotonobetainyl-CoA:carnitine CoA-transferase CaiB-like acyl-CoA transferase